MKSKIRKKTFFHPIVMDENGMLRKKFNSLHAATNIQKRALAAKIFELGINMLENTIK